MLIPSLLAIDAPNTLRAFDTLPPALLIAALAMDAVWTRLVPPSPAAAGEGRLSVHLQAMPKANVTKAAMSPPLPLRRGRGAIPAFLVLATIFALNAGTYFGLMRHDGKETLRFDTYFASQAGERMVAEAGARPGMTFLAPRAAIDRDVFPFFARVMGDTGALAPLDGVAPTRLPARYAILLPNGTGDPAPDGVIAALPWAKGLERVPGDSPAGAGGVPAFIEYRTPG